MSSDVFIHKLVAFILGIAILIATSWFLHRASILGLNNVFSREHLLQDDRQLTDEVAIDLSRLTLEASGYDVELLSPYTISSNIIDSDRGYVLWGRKGRKDQWHLLVQITKENGIVRSRVFRGK